MRTDGRTDRQTDRRTHKRTLYGNPTGSYGLRTERQRSTVIAIIIAGPCPAQLPKADSLNPGPAGQPVRPTAALGKVATTAHAGRNSRGNTRSLYSLNETCRPWCYLIVYVRRLLTIHKPTHGTKPAVGQTERQTDDRRIGQSNCRTNGRTDDRT